MNRYVLLCCVLLGFPSFAKTSDLINSDYYSKTQTTWGGIGLIQNPTARFAEDGEFTFGISTEAPYTRLYGTIQYFPWAEFTLRYTEGTYAPYNLGSQQTWKDKGMDFKLRLLEESDKRPGIALGFIDVGGTGAYASEYIVASKRFNNLDTTLGVAWGHLGEHGNIGNPLGWLKDSRTEYDTLGGQLNFGNFFAGKKAALFTGLEYFTPVPNLSVKLEYDTSDYLAVDGKEINYFKTGDIFEVNSRFNIALNYRLATSD